MLLREPIVLCLSLLSGFSPAGFFEGDTGFLELVWSVDVRVFSGFAATLGFVWARPFYMLLREPIVLCLSLLSGFSDALIFTFLESVYQSPSLACTRWRNSRGR
jgi:hypothetical protein